uniref:Uncharacterized protein n=1 Tax=Strigamia maritima TaxID=126957 RepID=T1JCM8_STRMM
MAGIANFFFFSTFQISSIKSLKTKEKKKERNMTANSNENESCWFRGWKWYRATDETCKKSSNPLVDSLLGENLQPKPLSASEQLKTTVLPVIHVSWNPRTWDIKFSIKRERF